MPLHWSNIVTSDVYGCLGFDYRPKVGAGPVFDRSDHLVTSDVLISFLNEDSDAEETARVVREAGRQAVLAPGDISEEAHCRSLVEQAVSELGKLDILVNNAAYQMTRDGIEQIPDGEWEHTFKTNVYCPQ